MLDHPPSPAPVDLPAAAQDAGFRERVRPGPGTPTALPWTGDSLAKAAPSTAPPPSPRRITLRKLLLGADVVAAVVAGVLAGTIGGLSVQPLFVFVGLAAFAWPLTAFLGGLYVHDDPPSWTAGVAEGKQLALICLGLSWPLWGLAALIGADRPAQIAASATVILFLSTLGTRGVTRSLAHRIEPLRQRTVVLGSGTVAALIGDRLKRHPELGIEPIGLVDDDPFGTSAGGLPHLGGRRDLARIIREHEVDRVIVAFSRASHQDLIACLRVCRDSGVAIDVIPRLFELLDSARRIDRVGGIPVLALDPPDFTRTSMAAKRTLDIVVSGLLLALLSPLMIVIALAVKLDSRGPVFFAQQRSGRANKVFRLFKFRSMQVDADSLQADLHHLNESADGVMFKIRIDPRVTRVGRLLRMSSLDELPQLLNVLLGHMSLVGPRPLVLRESAQIADASNGRRVDLRPGITGPWQVYGRSEIPFHEMLGYDYQYVSGWSLARDFEILLATVPALLSRRGAY